jgi:hypothetical protein
MAGIFVLYQINDLFGLLLGLFIISLGIIISGIVVTTVHTNNRNLRDKNIDFFDL